MRRLLAIGLVVTCLVGGGLAACGDDETAGPGPGGPDGSATSDGALPDTGSNPFDIVGSDLVVYTSSTASLDISQTNAQSFQWIVKTAPAGSAVSTQSLVGATTARPSFVADLSGDYELEVTARSATSVGTRVLKVKAVPAPLFYMQTNLGENPSYFEYRVVGTDKSGSHPIACRINSAPTDGGPDPGIISVSFMLADIGLDWWEAPPGAASRVAFGSLIPPIDGGGNGEYFLGLGTSESSCQSPPAQIRGLPEDGGAVDSISILQPRFSPNGARVAYVEHRTSGYYVAAVSYDGKDRRDLASFCGGGASECWKPALFPSRPQWVDAQTLGWARGTSSDGGDGWQVMLADDSANPNLRVHMTCGGAAPRSIAFLPDGSVIANRAAAGTEIEDLLVLRPATPGGACQLVRNLTNLPTKRSYARDFSLSADKTEIAFVRVVEPADAGPPDGGNTRFGGELYVAPVSGASAPTPLLPTRQYALFGPRYVAGGSLLAWNGAIPYEDGGVPEGGFEAGIPALRTVARRGGDVNNVVVSNLDAGIYVVGGGNGGSCDFKLCSFAAGQTSGGGALAALGVALALVLRRRRRP